MNDIYQTITDKIIAELEAGTVPWVRPWSGEAGRHSIRLILRHTLRQLR